MQDYVEALKKMLVYVEGGFTDEWQRFNHYWGICGNTRHFGASIYDMPHKVRESMFSSWEHFSGCTVFPIPLPNGILWEGKRFKHRISLIKYCIKYLEKLK